MIGYECCHLTIAVIIAVFGLITLIGVLCTKKRGFGPYNLRAVGIVLVATFAAILGTLTHDSMTAAIGILV